MCNVVMDSPLCPGHCTAVTRPRNYAHGIPRAGILTRDLSCQPTVHFNSYSSVHDSTFGSSKDIRYVEFLAVSIWASLVPLISETPL